MSRKLFEGSAALVLKPFRDALVGQPVSHVWQGHGSTIFIEFGLLTPSTRVRRDGSMGNPHGEITVMIELSWRIEKPRSILGGNGSSKRKQRAMLDRLLGAGVTDVKTFGVLPEIEISLSNGLRVLSFMIDEGQPEWSIVSRKDPKGSLCVRRGRLHAE